MRCRQNFDWYPQLFGGAEFDTKVREPPFTFFFFSVPGCLQVSG
jgi:hypothetical protein